MNFLSLGLNQQIIDAIKICGYQTLTPIQQQVIPIALKGKDIMASAQTGTGKTAAFALPMINQLIAMDERLSASDAKKSAEFNDDVTHNRKKVKALVITPTRELAIQVAQQISKYSQLTQLTTLAIYGGANINPQRKQLNAGVDILVATPGRLFDIINQYGLQLNCVTQLVIDEADRMLDLGFIKDIERVKSLVSPKHTTHFFSATYSEEVKALATKMLQKPTFISTAGEPVTSALIQEVLLVEKRRKAELLSELIGKHNWQQVLVFVSSKESAEYLKHELKLDGIKCDVFHGDKKQGARNRALDAFKGGKLRVLIATDIAARGLDIISLPLVINFELPFEAEDYLHRIGRTGRAGRAGQAISFVCPAERRLLAEIEVIIKQNIKQKIIAGYELGAPLPARYREPEQGERKKIAQPKHRRKGKSSKRNARIKR